MSDPGEIAPDYQPDWLPSGWTEVKDSSGLKVMYYRNMETGQTFYCKEDLRCYINRGNVSCSSPEPIGNHSELRTETEPGPVVVKKVKFPGWLPRGWSMEIRTRDNGMQYKCFVEPESGRRFYSKPKVFEYLGNVNSSAATKERPDADIQTGEEFSPVAYASQRNETPEWLPDGWTMELKIHRSGKCEGKTYKCFIDPATGRKFFSKPQVYDYLKTVNNSVCGQKRPYADHQTGKESSPAPDASESNEIPEWLPNGWTMEVKTRGSGKTKGRIDKCFVDPESGRKLFSKRQVYDYLKTVNSSVSVQKRHEADSLVGEKSSSESDGSHNGKPMIKSSISKQKEGGMCKQSMQEHKVIERSSVDGLPLGWIREVRTKRSGTGMRKDPYFIDPLSGYEFRSKVDALRYLEAGDIEKCAIRPKKGAIFDADSLNGYINETESVNEGLHHTECINGDIMVSERGSAEGLPSGWIREIRSKKSTNGMRKDPYYIDPLSGYEFRSKVDALRYLKTGDINSCAIKPKKRGINGTKSVAEDNSPLCVVDGQEAMQSSTKRQLFARGLAAADVESSKEREENSFSPIGAGTEKHPNGTAGEKCSEAEGKSDSEAKASFAESGTLSAPATDRLLKLKLADKGAVEQNKQQTPSQLTKSKKDKTSQPLPGRSSKRLKGFEPEMEGVSLFSGRSTRAAARGTPKQLEAEPEGETSGAAEEEQRERKSVDKQNDGKTEGKESELLCPLGDSSWLDPCLEFAVKTLTGAIPVEGNMIIQGVSKPPGP